MRSALVLLPVGAVLWTCSAPSPDEAPDRGPTPSPAELRREGRAQQTVQDREAAGASTPTPSSAEHRVNDAAAPPHSVAPPPDPSAVVAPGSALGADTEVLPAAAPEVAPPPPVAPVVRSPPPVAATARDQLPPLPFTAYTTAPLVVAGMDLQRTGVRVEVIGLEGDLAEVICSACPEPATGKAGAVPLNRLRAGRAPGGSGDALDTVLMLRARWAGGASLPEGATNIEMCALADHGFVLAAEQPTWSHKGGSVSLRWSGQVWDLAMDPTRPTEATGWSCRAGGQIPVPSPSPRSSEEP